MDTEPSDSPFAFRYPLRQRTAPDGAGAPLEMLRQQVRDLLDMVTLTSDGHPLRVDGFKTLADDVHVHRLFTSEDGRSTPGPSWPLQSRRNASLYEPRIELIARLLESVLALVELEAGGRPVAPDGFRLRDPRHWAVPSATDPLEVFGYGGGYCNVGCVFCYNDGNPPDLALGHMRRPAADSAAEMRARLRHFDPETGRALFPAMGDIYEVLAHPEMLPLLRELRAKTDAVFRLSTSGRLLTPAVAAALAELQPVFVHLSLHSASAARLAELVGTPVPENHLQAPRVLREHGVPYALVTVPWPAGGVAPMLDDLRALVEFADGEMPCLVEVHLPGYTRFFSSQPLFDREEVWSAVVGLVREVRPRTRTPVVVMPGLYEEALAEGPLNRPVLAGTVPNSPAEGAGLRTGDVLEVVGAVTTAGRPEARDALAAAAGAGFPVPLRWRRGGETIEAAVDPAGGGYPYDGQSVRHLGAVFAGGAGFRAEPLWRLRDIIRHRGARRVLFFSSLLVRPYMEAALRDLRPLAGLDVRLDIRVPENGYFGGNIILGDLLVVQDFVDATRQYVREEGAPDLIVVPSTPFRLGAWKRDLTGRPYLDIERVTGVPVELLECQPVYD